MAATAGKSSHMLLYYFADKDKLLAMMLGQSAPGAYRFSA